MKSAGKARNDGLYRHIRTSKEIIRNLLNDYNKYIIQRNLDDEQMDFQNDCMHQKYIGKESWIQELKIEKRACRRLQKPIKRVTLYKHCLKNLCLNLIAG